MLHPRTAHSRLPRFIRPHTLRVPEDHAPPVNHRLARKLSKASDNSRAIILAYLRTHFRVHLRVLVKVLGKNGNSQAVAALLTLSEQGLVEVLNGGWFEATR